MHLLVTGPANDDQQVSLGALAPVDRSDGQDTLLLGPPRADNGNLAAHGACDRDVDGWMRFEVGLEEDCLPKRPGRQAGVYGHGGPKAALGVHLLGDLIVGQGSPVDLKDLAGGGFALKGKTQPGVILIPLKTANRNNRHGNNITIAKAVDLAVKYGARIINLSLQTIATPPAEKDPLYQSLNRAAEKDIVLIAASGNTNDALYANLDNWSQYNLLTNHPQVISVAATEVHKDGTVKIATWSNEGKVFYGFYCKTITLSAPGKDIHSTVPTSFREGMKYDYFSGTSMAAAVTSGAASLILSKNFRLSARQVKNILTASATPLYVYGGGSGEVHFARALRATPAILEPFIDISIQLLKGFPKSYRKRGRQIIKRSPIPVKDIKESDYYDLRIALMKDYFLQLKRSKEL